MHSFLIGWTFKDIYKKLLEKREFGSLIVIRKKIERNHDDHSNDNKWRWWTKQSFEVLILLTFAEYVHENRYFLSKYLFNVLNTTWRRNPNSISTPSFIHCNYSKLSSADISCLSIRNSKKYRQIIFSRTQALSSESLIWTKNNQFAFIANTLNFEAMNSYENSSKCTFQIKFYTCTKCLEVFPTECEMYSHAYHIHYAFVHWILTERPCDKIGLHYHWTSERKIHQRTTPCKDCE